MKKRRRSSEIAVKRLRNRINRLDSRLVCLLDERAQAALGMAELKKNSGAGYYAPDREQEVHARVRKLSQGIFPRKALHAVYREVMSGCLGLEDKFIIAHPGAPGSPAGRAARSRFGSSLSYKSLSSTGAMLRDVQAGRSGYCVMELENSKRGLNAAALRLLLKSRLRICAEILYPEPSIDGLPHTRFVVLGKSEVKRTGYDRTSLVLQIPVRRGSLNRIGESLDAIMDALEAARMRVSHVESIAKLGRPGFVGLFMDLIGHRTDPGIRRGLKKISRLSKGLRILGSYPRQTW